MTGSYYNDDIARQTIQLWLQVKRVKKLRNKYTVKKRVEERYHTCYKFDRIWKFIVHNVIFLTEKADINLYGDDTIFVTALYGETGKCVTGRVKNKYRVIKLGQTVFLSYAN